MRGSEDLKKNNSLNIDQEKKIQLEEYKMRKESTMYLKSIKNNVQSFAWIVIILIFISIIRILELATK